MQTHRTILIIETEATDQFAVRVLQHANWGVHSVADTNEGVRKIKQLDPDLLLFETNSYSIRRANFWDQVRNDLTRIDRHRPLVVLTSSQCQSDEVAALNDGADDYIFKPISEMLLTARLGRLFRSSRGRPLRIG